MVLSEWTGPGVQIPPPPLGGNLTGTGCHSRSQVVPALPGERIESNASLRGGLAILASRPQEANPGL